MNKDLYPIWWNFIPPKDDDINLINHILINKNYDDWDPPNIPLKKINVNTDSTGTIKAVWTGDDSLTIATTTTTNTPPTDNKPPTYPINIGWVCPKCGRVLSPWTSSCGCSEKWEITCSSN